MEKGDLVINRFEVVEYLGYEEHEDDHYHRLLSLITGEYLSSAVGSPEEFKDSKGYKETKRLWDLNKPMFLRSLESTKQSFETFCNDINIELIGYKCWYSLDRTGITLFDTSKDSKFGGGNYLIHITSIDISKLKNFEYSNYITEYILNEINKYENA